MPALRTISRKHQITGYKTIATRTAI